MRYHRKHCPVATVDATPQTGKLHPGATTGGIADDFRDVAVEMFLHSPVQRRVATVGLFREGEVLDRVVDTEAIG